MSAKPDLLTIQKFVSLLDDFHYGQFIRHLAEIKAALPLKLVKSISKKLPAFHTHEELCKSVYGTCSKKDKLNFNQLSAYTLRLSSNLAQNYPSYLHHNVSRVEQLINEGKRKEAMLLADNLLDISGIAEDFQCEIRILKLLAQQAFLTKDIAKGFKLNERLEKAYENEGKYHYIIFSLRKMFYQPGPGHKPENLEEVMKSYRKYHEDPSAAIRILSKYAHVYSIYYYKPGMFDSPEDLKLIKSLEKDLQNNSQVVFPFLFDIKGILGFLKLNSALLKPDTQEGEKFMTDLQKHYDSVLFWNYYVNMPQLFLMAARSSQFLTKYHYLIHRADYHQLVRPKDLETMNSLIARTEEFLKNQNPEQFYGNDMISVRMLYGGLLIFSGGKNVQKGVKELESLLLAYQQINLSGSTDSVFLCLMIGYFSMQNHEKCEETFRRYQKVIKNKPIYEGNDISIHTYYYLSKWLTSHSAQYTRKLSANYARTSKDEGPRKAMDALLAYFEIPVDLKK